MDTIITKEGRRQIHDGELKIKFVSFTDRHTFYCDDGDLVAENLDNRIFFEAISRLQDQIVFETNDEGMLTSFGGSDVNITDGGALTVVPDTAGIYDHKFITGSIDVTGELTDELLADSELNFKNQQIIATFDNASDTSGFELNFTSASGPKGPPLNSTSTEFYITLQNPLHNKLNVINGSIDNQPSLWQDSKLQHLPFYQYLPPVNVKKPYQLHYKGLGNYPRLNQGGGITIDELEEKLKTKQAARFRFSETSRDNNIVMQFVEVGEGKISKLAMIDFGEFPNEDPYSPGKHVFFVGKIFPDGTGMHTYINIFTVVLE
jgi:hypothetical protein